MNPTILNREFQHPADGWYQIEPNGLHPNREAGVIQVIDETATQAIVNRFNTDADAGKLSHGTEMLIDHEHFKHDLDKETRAYGWLNRLESRADGIYGRIRWSATGKAAVDGGDYRFFSTEYDPADIKVLNADGKMKRVRPLRLDGLTLTNNPNNKGGKPITNRGEAPSPSDLRRGSEAEAGREQTTQRTTMKSVAGKLGLSADASEDSILAEVTKIMNRAAEAEAQVTPLKNRVTTLETENTTLLGEQIDADLEAAGIKDTTIINRHKPLLSDTKHFKNRADRKAYIADIAKGNATKPQLKLHNRDTKPPGTAAATEEGGDDAAEQKKATLIMNRAHELMTRTPSLSLATACRMAQNEVN